MSLPFKTPKPQTKIKIGSKESGEVEVPLYGGLLTGEAVEVARLLQRIGRELKKKASEVTDEDIAPYKPDLALILIRYRVEGGSEITLKDLENVPWSIVDRLAQVMLSEITADTLRQARELVDEVGEGGEKKEQGQPQS